MATWIRRFVAGSGIRRVEYHSRMQQNAFEPRTGCSPPETRNPARDAASAPSTTSAAASEGHPGGHRRADEKACSDCREALPLDAFHRLTKSPDGRQRRCKACIKAYQQNSPTWREVSRANARRYQQQRPEAKRAHGKVAAAIRRGDLVRPSCCSVCDKDGPVDGHHHLGCDFPLDVQWLCRSCHITIEPRRGQVAS